MGLEEAVMNQAPVGLENGADRAATSRENPVPSTAPSRKSRGHKGFWIFSFAVYFIQCKILSVSSIAVPSRVNFCKIISHEISHGLFDGFIGAICSPMLIYRTKMFQKNKPAARKRPPVSFIWLTRPIAREREGF